MSTQAALQTFFPLPVNVAVIVVLAAVVLGAVLPRRRPPAKRVQPF